MKVILATYLTVLFILVGLFLFIGASAKADGLGGSTCMPNCNGYVQGDHFQLSDYDTDVHILAGTSMSMLLTLIYEHKLGVPKWEAAGLAAITVGTLGTAKEVFIDDYNSRTDTKAWWTGGILGGFSIAILNF